MSDTQPLTPDYTLEETAAALRMSTRWVRNRIKAGEDPEDPAPPVAHERRGHKIIFTAEQVEALRTQFPGNAAVAPVQSITTGRKKSRS